jgi:hypothetical protein
VSKSGSDAVMNWNTVTCSDLASYQVYAATSYNAPFPSGWTLLGNTITPTFSNQLTSPYIAYTIISVDLCGN